MASTFDAHTARTLTAMARQLYPHDFLADAHYAKVVEIVAAEADADRAWKIAGRELQRFGYTRDGEYTGSALCLPAGN